MKFSTSIGAVPSTLFVPDVVCIEKDAPRGFGGFADVFCGQTVGGQKVALKRLRMAMYQDGSRNTWTKVSAMCMWCKYSAVS